MNGNALEQYRRGTALVCVGRYSEAIACFDRALESDSDNPETLIALGAAVDRLGLFHEAIVCCDRALASDPGLTDAWFMKGLALFRVDAVTKLPSDESIAGFMTMIGLKSVDMTVHAKNPVAAEKVKQTLKSNIAALINTAVEYDLFRR